VVAVLAVVAGLDAAVVAVVDADEDADVDAVVEAGAAVDTFDEAEALGVTRRGVALEGGGVEETEAVPAGAGTMRGAGKGTLSGTWGR
jgi:hypothetical protein